MKYSLSSTLIAVNVEFVVATTKLINGNTFLKTVMDTLDPDSLK